MTQRWLPVINTETAKAVPPFGVMEVCGVDANGNIQVRQPTGAFGAVLFNGPVGIAAGAEGQGTRDWPVVAAYSGSDPAAQDLLVSTSGSWFLSASGQTLINQYGYKVVGGSYGGMTNVVPSLPFGIYYQNVTVDAAAMTNEVDLVFHAGTGLSVVGTDNPGVSTTVTYTNTGVLSLNTLTGALSIGAGSGIAVSSLGTTVTVSANPFVAAGPSHAAGAVPDPGSTSHTLPYVLGDDASFHQLLSAKGDLLVTSGSTLNQLSVGTDGWVLTADSASLNGVKWAAAGGGMTNPMTTLGDIIYEDATPAPARLAGNATGTKKFLTQTGTGSVSAAPAWGTITSSDLPDSGTSLGTEGAFSGNGTTQAGATAITTAAAVLTPTGGNTAFLLPDTAAALIRCWNASASVACAVFPPGTEKINNGGASGSISIPVSSGRMFARVSSTQWVSWLSG